MRRRPLTRSSSTRRSLSPSVDRLESRELLNARSLIDVSSPIAQVGHPILDARLRALHAHLGTSLHTASTTAPSLVRHRTSQVRTVGGTVEAMHPQLVVFPTAPGQSTTRTGASPLVTNPTPPAGALTPSKVQTAYGWSGDGSGQTIVIVDAYDDPNIASDLATFDAQYGLAAPPSFKRVNQSGATSNYPSKDASGGWEFEESLDVEWAHAMAPKANIILVEANSNSNTNLYAAVNTAKTLGSVVSMSWGGSEYSTETSNDSTFVQPGVTFVVSSGDTGAPVQYPAISPNVLAVGGTTLTLNSNGTWSSEVGWSGSSGGISAYETQPSYQKGVVTQSTTYRTNPDVAYNADPNTGYAVYDSVTYYPYYPAKFGAQSGWFQVGGTSAAAPQWAALIAIADQDRIAAGKKALGTAGAQEALTDLYSSAYTADYHDITSGTSTGSPNYTAAAGYDLVTGRGTPNTATTIISALTNS